MDRYLSEAKAFALRSHVIEFTVAVLAAFAISDIVFSGIRDIIAPVISMIFGETSLGGMDFDINDSVFRYGSFIQTILYVGALAAVVMLFVVGPFNQLASRMRSDPSAAPDTRACPECLSAIPAAARRCRYCTAESSPASQGSAPPSPPPTE